MNYRPLVESDLDVILEIEGQSFKTPWPRDAFEREFGNPVSRNLVLEENDRIVAFAVAWLVADELHILDLAVSPAQRRRGLGKALVRELLRRAEGEGVVSAFLEVRPSNRAALGLYRGLGFRKIGRRLGYYADNGEDALVMASRFAGGRSG